MKRVISVLLCAVLFLSCLIPAFAETEPEAESAGVNPVIVIPGIAESMLVLDKGTPNETRYYQPVTSAFDGLKKDLILGTIKALLFGSYKQLTDAGIALACESTKYLEMTPDGTSVYNMSPAVVGAAESSYAAIRQNGRWGAIDHGAHILPFIADRIGGENVFFFCYDYRLGAITLANQLKDFIGEVKAQTGRGKVDIYGNSYGSLITLQYLNDFGGADDVERILFCSPAWQGSKLFKDLFPTDKNDFRINPAPMACIVQRLGMREWNIETLLKLIPQRILRNVGYEMIQEIMKKYLWSAPGIWCLCSVDDYEEMKAAYLDPVANAAVIEECDAVQYGVMRNIPAVLAQAKADGIGMSVLMGEGVELTVGKNVNGDGLLDTASGTGGECLPLGETFEDGRSGKYISPANDLDLTNAFLPDNTWVVRGMTHGQTYWDDELLELTMKLLLTDDLKDGVDADPAFPQFTDSHCPSDDVSIRLETRRDNFLALSDGKIKATLRNDSRENEIYVTGVTVCGMSYAVTPVSCRLMPGETKEITLTPLKTLCGTPQFGKINVTYVEKDYIMFSKSRSLFYTVE
ncbi:MAG: hypothetical protein IJL26_01280 [Clostridia bacterium]|nr:hypothetical protein [Clostridia bacterium]